MNICQTSCFFLYLVDIDTSHCGIHPPMRLTIFHFCETSNRHGVIFLFINGASLSIGECYIGAYVGHENRTLTLRNLTILPLISIVRRNIKTPWLGFSIWIPAEIDRII